MAADGTQHVRAAGKLPKKVIMPQRRDGTDHERVVGDAQPLRRCMKTTLLYEGRAGRDWTVTLADRRMAKRAPKKAPSQTAQSPIRMHSCGKKEVEMGSDRAGNDRNHGTQGEKEWGCEQRKTCVNDGVLPI